MGNFFLFGFNTLPNGTIIYYMIRIRTMHSVDLPISRDRLAQAQEIFRRNFPGQADYADRIPELLEDPFKHGYRAVLLVAETATGRVNGFCLLLHFTKVNSTFLDFIGVRTERHSGGFGGALYEAAREYCQDIGSRGLFLEVQPDDPEHTPDPAVLEQARNRLRFYERYGVRPILGSAYATPVGDPPTTAYLLYDGLNRTEPLRQDQVQSMVRCVLQQRFGHVVPPDYIERIVGSFQDDPVRIRPLRYSRGPESSLPVAMGRLTKPIALVSNHKHTIHHVRSRGYLERPARIGAILEALSPLPLFSTIPPRRFSESAIMAVHDRHFVEYLKTVCTKLSKDVPIYPDTFPIRRPDRRPKVSPVQAGFYCIDSCTPLDGNAYLAARASVDVALTGADELLSGTRTAYALCRPPGHHAERRVYGGFCYFNNAAIAANYLSPHGPVAILDIDFHHGNGTQDIFYHRSDVLMASLHGHPDHAFPYFSGFADETGEGPGLGYNVNFPLPAGTEEAKYLAAFDKALRRLERFRPMFLVVSLGLDILKGDPTATFDLPLQTLRAMGRRLSELAVPLLVVQEGGYNLRNLKRGAVAFFTGLADATIIQ
jgi:acetoin utilization deacetylase AcuC-like enzyme/GNAT superfamily N-acetyltransferase